MMQPNETLIEERFIRAGGPGGQNVNKVSTAVEMRYHAGDDVRLNGEQKARLARLAGSRMTRDGDIILRAQVHRTQEANRAEARRRLAELLSAALIRPRRRRATKPTRGSVERRLTGKSVRARTKASRRRPDADS